MINLESINKQHAANRVSNKYSFIPTTRILDTLKNAGWEPTQWSEVNTRKEDKKGFQKHLIRLRNNSSQQSNDLTPEIVLTNSHDGCASFNLMAGVFRFVCSNGLIIADSLVANHKIRHQGYTEGVVKEAIYNIVEEVPTMFNKAEEFQNVHLTEDDKRAFGLSALSLAYDEERLESTNIDKTITNLIQPRRSADQDSNLWNSFNTIQEKFINGGRFLVENKTSPYGYDYSRTRKTSKVKSIDKNVKLNKALWEITEYFSKQKAGV